VKKRLPFFAFLALGALLWRGGFGFLATDRTLTWRFPVPYAEVRRVDVQVWSGEELLKRVELATPSGLSVEPECTVPLARGTHTAIGTVWLADGGDRSFQRDFDPAMQREVVVAF
jgi:hypothetical protein